MALLLVINVAISAYENYYPPRVAELAEFTTKLEAKRAKQRAEAPRLMAKFRERMCAHAGELVDDLRTLYLIYNPKWRDPTGREDYEDSLRRSFKGTFEWWAQHCAGYFTDPESWKQATFYDEVRAIKMSRKQLRADKNILFYTLNPPPQAVHKYRLKGPSVPAPPKNEAEVEADQVAREAVRAWYDRAWHQTCSQ